MKMEKRRFSTPKAGFVCLGVVVFLMSVCASLQASLTSVTLGWNSATNIAGYALYYGTNSGNYTTRIDVGTNTTAVASNLTADATYYFAVTAYNAAKVESAPSSPVAYLVPGKMVMSPASKITPLTIKFPVAPGHTYTLQASTDMKTWTNLWPMGTASSNAWVSFKVTNAASFSRRFYRLSMSP